MTLALLVRLSNSPPIRHWLPIVHESAPRYTSRAGEPRAERRGPGAAHVASQIERLKRDGAGLAGQISVGGQPLEVLSPREGTYHLFAPHPWGTPAVMYYWLIVSSSLGDEATLRILGAVVPNGGC